MKIFEKQLSNSSKRNQAREKNYTTMKKCPSCRKGYLRKVNDIIFDIENNIFITRGARCSKCKEEFTFEKEVQKVIEISRRLGIWS